MKSVTIETRIKFHYSNIWPLFSVCSHKVVDSVSYTIEEYKMMLPVNCLVYSVKYFVCILITTRTNQEECNAQFYGRVEGLMTIFQGYHAFYNSLGQANQIYCFASATCSICVRAGGHSSLFITTKWYYMLGKSAIKSGRIRLGRR